jgi:dephospho-CoA kinase
MRALRIGLTGGIGSGKSTVAACLVRLGATLIDTDAIARTLTAAGGAAMSAIRGRFGDGVIDDAGALDRERMRALAFADPSALAALEAILHPMIGAESDLLASAADGPIVFDVPLLVESGRWRARVDRVLVVDCSEATQIERVVQRSGWDADVVRRVIAKQAPRLQRLAAADACLYNDGIDLLTLEHQIETLARAWL